MTKKFLFTAIALCVGAFANAGTISLIDASQFVNPSIERFTDSTVKQASYDFGNRLGYASLDGGSDFVKTNDWYAFGDSGVTGGSDDEWYFSTDLSGKTSSTFEFNFAGGVTRFGFAGGEFSGSDNPLDDGIMDLLFYDMNNDLIGPMQVSNGGAFSWGDFNGFEVSTGAISRVVFQNVGHLALDDISFEGAAAPSSDVPEPASLALLGLGLAGVGAARRKAARK